MKKSVLLIVAALFFLTCEGDKGSRGPTGPQGAEGPVGSSGATINYITGVVASADYGGAYIWIDDTIIQEDCFVQVFISPDKNTYAWQNVVDYQLTDARIYVYDPYRDYVGYDYEIRIIPKIPGLAKSGSPKEPSNRRQ